MEMLDIIAKKRDGGELTNEEIRFWIKGYVAGEIPDYQVAALLMAIYFNGMTDEETYALTAEMQHSGDEVDLSPIKGVKVDKHSTGGVGDKTTLIVAPIVAAAGIKVAKMSGRGLGHTGGTADKLEAIPGFRVQISTEDFFKQVEEVGAAVITQTEHITPADKLLYALRDVTGTVKNKSLIASSIMSKKLASGADAIVLDVKCGDGAFFKTEEEARAVSELMIGIGSSAGRAVSVLVSDMEQPLGKAIGNTLEVIEAIDVLKDQGPWDIREISLRLAGEMIFVGGGVTDPEEGYKLAEELLVSGEGLKYLARMIEAQGGSADIISDYSLFAKPEYEVTVTADKAGYISAIKASKAGVASRHTGAGRMKKSDVIDPSAGILLSRKCGEYVEAGTTLATVYSNNENKAKEAAAMLMEAFEISDDKPADGKLIKAILRNR